MATSGKLLITSIMTFTAVALFAAPALASQAPPKVTTEQLSGEVVQVEGNNLVVRMANGELRTFSNIPDSRRATIDGKEVGVRDLTPGTKLTTTITRTESAVAVRTTNLGNGKVWHTSGNTVILILPNGETKQYTVKPDFRFIVNGKPASVSELRPGMTVSADKIVEEPKVEISTDGKIVGQAPK